MGKEGEGRSEKKKKGEKQKEKENKTKRWSLFERRRASRENKPESVGRRWGSGTWLSVLSTAIRTKIPRGKKSSLALYS